MSQYKYVVVDESWDSYKYLFGSLSEAEAFAKRRSSELSRSDITMFVLHIPTPAQPRIHHADDVNQFAEEDWRVARAYYKGRVTAKDRFKRWGIVLHEPRKAKEEAWAAAMKADADARRAREEQEYQAQRQAAHKAAVAATAKQRAENEAWNAKTDSTLISEAKKYARITGDTAKTDSERFRAKTQVEKRLRELTDRGRMDVPSISSELSMIAMGREPDIPPILTATPAPAARKQPKRKPAPTPDMPPILAAPPELAADVLGGGMGLTPAAAKRKPAARTTRKKTAAKPKAKKPTAGTKLTPAQREYLAINGFVRVKRGGKYITITN